MTVVRQYRGLPHQFLLKCCVQHLNKKDKLGPVVGDVAAAQAAETPGVPDSEPVGGAVDRAPVMSRIHECLQEQDLVAKAERSVPHQAPRAQRQHP